jgi:uncharacterized membrane protein
MKDYLSFRKMITPVIIQAVFWVGLGIIIIVAFYQIVSGVAVDSGGGLRVLSGLGWLVFGPILWRLTCELLILLFRIDETLTNILKATKRKK